MSNNVWTRRQFLAATAAFAAAPVLGEGSPFQFRYLLPSCMYGTMRLAEILPEVAKIHADGIDLWPKVHGDQREQADALGRDGFGRLLKEHGVRLAMTTRYDLGPYGLEKEMEYLHDFGGSLIVTGSGKPPQGSLKEAVREFVTRMEPHLAVAERLGVTIAIENHGKALIESPDSLRYLADFAKSSPRLGIALAPYHLPQEPETLAGLIRDLGPKLVHFYAWEHGMGCMTKLPKDDEMKQLPGYGSLDFGPVVKALRDIQYGGHVEVFMHPVPRGVPILPTAGEVTAAMNKARVAFEKSLTG
ncbi:sugar phosphate isomerase/epimerase family protein [Caulifigura coniformis]|nr:sugar phosphate isomerase/epimerase family protein [Caulifigura coniformis]